MALGVMNRCDFCAGTKIGPLHFQQNFLSYIALQPDETRVNFRLWRADMQWINYQHLGVDRRKNYGFLMQKEGGEKKVHQFSCTCTECQIKYGSLPVLVEVIEDQEKFQHKKTEENCSKTQHFEPQPSTSYGFSSSSKLEAKREMKCSHCDKSFSHKGDFNKHLRIHTGEQPYSCPTCNRKFAHTSNLSRHLKVHSGDRPFVCDVCHKTFSRVDKLKLHQKSKSCKKNIIM